jgi:hypothetical protein
MDAEEYGELAHAICSALSRSELDALHARLRALPDDADRESLLELLTVQQRGLRPAAPEA